MGDIALFVEKASAAQIVNRSFTLSSSANGNVADGGAGEGGNGAQATHTFGFTEGDTGATVGSIEFLYCTTPLPTTTCTTPTGMDASTVVSVGTGGTGSEWTFDAATTNSIRLTRSGGAGLIANAQTLTFGAGSTGSDYIKNPTTDNEEFFVRITTFSDATYTTEADQGTVASAVAQQIDVTAKVQEVLNFSVAGDEDAVDAPGTSCDPLTGSGAVGLGDTDDVLSFSQAYDAHSYFRVSTNANNGTAVTYSGDTLTLVGGSTQIAAASSAGESSSVGSEQFGLAVDNTNGSHTFDTLASTSPYTQGNGTIIDAGTAQFAFDTNSVTAPVEVASSAGVAGDKTIVCDTGAVRYIGNVSTTTSAGIYTTTLTFIATPEY